MKLKWDNEYPEPSATPLPRSLPTEGRPSAFYDYSLPKHRSFEELCIDPFFFDRDELENLYKDKKKLAKSTSKSKTKGKLN